ncbi:hypothetical protein GCM10022243_19770 [Saccharothrix violaceirubra]
MCGIDEHYSDRVIHIPGAGVHDRRGNVLGPQALDHRRETMKHLRHLAARVLGSTRMGGFYTYWDIAN